jgi:hypothetical protein
VDSARAKKTAVREKLRLSAWNPVGIACPVAGQRIMIAPIGAFSLVEVRTRWCEN